MSYHCQNCGVALTPEIEQQARAAGGGVHLCGGHHCATERAYDHARDRRNVEEAVKATMKAMAVTQVTHRTEVLPPKPEEIWLRAYLAISSSWNCTDKEVPAKWADKCLADYQERFHHPKPNPELVAALDRARREIEQGEALARKMMDDAQACGDADCLLSWARELDNLARIKAELPTLPKATP